MVLFVTNAFQVFSQETIRTNYDSGTYGHDLEIFFDFSEFEIDDTEHISVYYTFNNSIDDPVLYEMPLYLSALPGERRVYNLSYYSVIQGKKSATTSKVYIIDKDLPDIPEVSVTNDSSGVVIRFATSKDTIVYYLGGEKAEWQGEPVVIPNSDLPMTLRYYAEDPAGNRTSMYTEKLEAMFETKRVVQCDLLSPVTGTFGNRQVLYLRHRGLESIRYTLDGSDPTIAGTEYTGPLLIDRTGAVSVRVVGKSADTSNIITREVRYTVIDQQDENPRIPNGIVTGDVVLRFSPPGGVLTLVDRSPKSWDSVYTDPLRIPSIPGAVKSTVVRYRPLTSEGISQIEYRYFLIMDNRRPPEPIIRLSKSIPVSSALTATITAAAFSEIRYTLDGSTPDIRSTRYNRPIQIELPETISTGSLILKAKAFAGNGLSSRESYKLITYDREPPLQPRLDALTVNDGVCTASFDIEADVDLLYELTLNGTEPVEPTSDSPTFTNPLQVTIPHGMQADLRLKIAAIDDAGNIAALDEEISVTLDRIPPKTPKISYEKNKIFMTSTEGTIRFSISETLDELESPNKESKLYDAPIAIDAVRGEIRTVYVSAVCIDDSGNLSRIVGPVTFSNNQTVPAMPRYTGIRDGASIDAEAAHLILAPQPPSVRIAYSISTDGSVPPDPDAAGPYVDGRLTFSGEAGKRLEFTVTLMPVNTISGLTGLIESVSFAMDLEPPELPGLSGFADDALYSDRVEITVIPNAPEDIVYISRLPDMEVDYTDITPDGMVGVDPRLSEQLDSDPFSGVPVRGKYTLDIPADSQRVVRFTVGVQDPAGNTRMDPTIHRCTIDRLPPTPPVPVISPDALVTNEQVVVSFTDGEGNVHYEIGVDGILPAHPNFRSTIFSDDIVFTGSPGEITVYSIAAVRIDAAGNVSAPWTHTLAIDRTDDRSNAPTPPQIMSNESEIRMEGSGEIRYEMRSDGLEPAIPNSASPIYTEPISLPESGVIKIRAISVGTSGKNSAVTDTVVIYPDPPKPVLPHYQGIVDGGVYGEKGAILRLYPVDDTVQVYYSIEESGGSDDSNTPISSERQSVLDDTIQVPGVADAETEYVLRLTAVHAPSGSEGEENTLRFLVDRKSPAMPEFSGLPYRMSTGRTVELTPDMLEASGRVYYSMTDDGTFPGSPFSGSVFSSSLSLRGREGRVVTYHIRLGIEDEAGNRTENPDSYKVIVDKEKPAEPIVIVPFDGTVSIEPVLLSILPRKPGEIDEAIMESENLSIFYELSEGEAVPEHPSPTSTPYSDQILLSGADGERTVYSIRAVAVDASGNVSNPSKIHRVVVDRRRVSVPESPNVAFESDRVSISWRTVPDRQIFFRLEGRGDGEFEQYSMPLIIPSSAAEGIKLHYYSSHDLGATSTIQELHLPSPSAEMEFVKGPSDFRVVNEALTIVKTIPSTNVRFEVSTGKLLPDVVDNFSPALPDEMKFDVADGETTSFSVRCAMFSQSQKIAERLFKFEIDKTPPPLPVVEGIEDGSYYRDDRRISITTGEGEIYYLLQQYRDGDYSDDGIFRKYDTPLLLRADEKGVDGYRLSAYAVDSVGNRSEAVAEWSFFFDKEIVYASPYGNDYYEGTRTRPVRSIDAALEIAGSTGRNTIFLVAGDYDIQQPITPDGALSIVGGLDPDDWSNAGDKFSTIRPGKYFPQGKSMFQVQDVSLRLNGLLLSDTSNRSPVAIEGINGDISVTRSSIIKGYLWQGKMIETVEGKITLLDCDFDGGVCKSGYILDCRDGIANIESSAFSGNTAETEFIPLVFNGMRTVMINECTVDPGSGSKITGVRITEGSFEAVDSTFNAGVGKLHATAVIVESGVVAARDCTFLTDSRSRLSSCVNLSNSKTKLIGCEFVTGAERGAIALQSRAGELTISTCRFEGSSAEEFLYLVKTDDTKMTIENSVLIGGRTSGDFIGVDCSGGAGKIFGNTMFLGYGEHLAYGITASGFEWLDIINNIILGRTTGSHFGVAVRARDARIVSNDLYGWDAVLEVGNQRIETVDRLNLSDNNPFGGITHDNITEPFRVTFAGETPEDIHLSPDSRCIDGGFDVSGIGGSAVDMEGQPRPNPDMGIKPRYDIGADEYY